LALKQLLSFISLDVLLAMRENDRIDPFAATYTAPIDRTQFEYRLGHHEAAAAVAAFLITLLLNSGCL